MVTDSLVKKKFVHETLQEDILKIYSTLSSVIDSTLGLRCRSFSYRYSEMG